MSWPQAFCYVGVSFAVALFLTAFLALPTLLPGSAHRRHGQSRQSLESASLPVPRAGVPAATARHVAIGGIAEVTTEGAAFSRLALRRLVAVRHQCHPQRCSASKACASQNSARRRHSSARS